MTTLISDTNILIRPTNFPISIDQQFDLDEVLTFAEMSTIDHDDQRDDHHDRGISVAETEQIPNSAFGFVAVPTVAGVDSCAVCMDSFSSGESGERIPCGHVYHAGCIVAWLSVCDSCPLCRCRISTDDRISRGGK